jgi:hypothetical protein
LKSFFNHQLFNSPTTRHLLNSSTLQLFNFSTLPAVADIFPTIPDILTSVADVLERVATATHVARIPAIFEAVQPVFTSVADVFATIPTILTPVPNVFQPVTHHGATNGALRQQRRCACDSKQRGDSQRLQ